MPAIYVSDVRKHLDRLENQVEASPTGQLTHALRSMQKRDLEGCVDIISYIEASWGLDDHPYPIQKFILKLVYGLPLLEDQVLDNLPALDEAGRPLSKDIILWDKFRSVEIARYTEANFIEFLHKEGRCTLNLESHLKRLGHKMSMVIMRMGRRSGKTTLSQWIAAYEIYLLTRMYSPQEYYRIRKDQPIRMTLISTSEEHARDLLSPARAAIQRAPILKQYVKSDSQDHVTMTTQRNIDLNIRAPAIKVSANACSARSLRGPANKLVILEEYGFFNTELKGLTRASNKTDREIYKAVSPSTGDFTNPTTQKQDSMIMVVSTPQTRDAHMYELETMVRDGKFTDGIVFWIPSYWMNYTYAPDKFRQEYSSDPEAFEQEYEADYVDRISAAFSDMVVERCRVDPCGDYGVVKPSETTWMGIDLGLKNDGTSVFVVAADSAGETRLVHRDVIRMYLPGYEEYVSRTESGQELDHLDIKKVGARIDYLWNYFGCSGGMYDQWNAYGLKASLNSTCRDALLHVEFNATNNDRLARHAISVINQKRLTIYASKEDWQDEESLLWELTHLQKMELGQQVRRIKIAASNIKGRHDDQYSALSRALWCAKVGTEDNNVPQSAATTPVHQRLAESLRQRVEQYRTAQKYTHGRNAPGRFRR